MNKYYVTKSLVLLALVLSLNPISRGQEQIVGQGTTASKSGAPTSSSPGTPETPSAQATPETPTPSAPTQATTPSTLPLPLALLSDFTVSNECWGIKAQPYSTYSNFGKANDGAYYGTKKGRLNRIDLGSTDLVYIKDKPTDEDPIQSLQNFKQRKGILAACPPTGSTKPESPAVSGSTDSSPTAQPNQPVQPTPSTQPQGPTVGQHPAQPVAASTSCNKSGEADSFVLAMSWQPAFCETKKNKAECSHPEYLKPDSFHASNFTLHGLWPNKNGCGVNYGFCSEVQSKPSFCAYEPLNLTQDTAAILSTLMPGSNEESCLERHEWNKHGTCQDMNRDEYFQYAARLVSEFDQSEAVSLVAKHIGGQISKEEFRSALDKSFGEGTKNSVIMVCKKNMLVEIQFSLKKVLKKDAKLNELIDKDIRGYSRGCGETIIIDAIGPQS